MTAKATTVEVFKGTGPQPYYFRAKARNGKVIAASEGYTRPWSARRGAQRAFPSARIVDLTKS